jgi:hypothetical protein
MAKYGPNVFAAWQNSQDLLIAWQNRYLPYLQTSHVATYFGLRFQCVQSLLMVEPGNLSYVEQSNCRRETTTFGPKPLVFRMKSHFSNILNSTSSSLCKSESRPTHSYEMSTNFKYQDLTSGSAEFRVLDLQPGSEADIIQCLIRTTSVSLPTSYAALSYCWADQSITKTSL